MNQQLDLNEVYLEARRLIAKPSTEHDKFITSKYSFATAMVIAFAVDLPSIFFNRQLKNGNLEKYFPEFFACVSCEQDPCYHSETVYNHTLAALDAYSLNAWRFVPEQDQLVCFLAILYHDIGKPLTRREINASSTLQSQEKNVLDSNCIVNADA